MSERKIKRLVRGSHTVDGAGVQLVRVLGNYTVYDFDPFLMLDSFDSTDPEDYIRGFPWHPHRGIETITYLIEGRIDHGDSLGNRGTIGPGECQWMTAGHGILHQEIPQPAKRMLGVQLWLNLPKDHKMTEPAYLGVSQQDVGVKRLPGATVRVIAGSFEEVHGVQPNYIPARILDLDLEPGSSMTLETDPKENVFVFLMEGDAIVEGQDVAEKTAILFGDGDTVTVAATEDAPLRALVCSAVPLGEPVAWGGPIVMNESEELEQAFKDLDEGRFTLYEPNKQETGREKLEGDDLPPPPGFEPEPEGEQPEQAFEADPDGEELN